MKDYRFKYIIYMVSNCIVYSKGYYLFEDDSVIGIIWSLSHYVFLGLVYIKMIGLVDFKKRKLEEIILFSSIYIISFLIMMCTFICSSKMVGIIKSYSFCVELILIFVLLVIYYKLSKTIIVKQINKQEKVIINGDLLYKFINDKTILEEEKRQVKSILWLIVCSILLCFVYFILPLCLRLIEANYRIIILAYFFSLFLFGAALYRKNYLIYIQKRKIFYVTLSEISGICIACIGDAYWNVYIWLLNTDMHTIYFAPYVVMALGSIPYLINADRNIKNLKLIILK